MIRPLRGLKRSLPARLLLVFIITAVCLLALIGHFVAKGFSHQWREHVRPHMIQYLDYVNTDIGNPPSIERARELAKNLPLNIYIEGPDTRFSSSGQPLDTSDLEFSDDDKPWRRKYRENRTRVAPAGKVSFGEYNDRLVLRNDLGDYQVYFELAQKGLERHRTDVLRNTLLFALGLLLLCYLLIRWMLRPVHDIKQGVEQMGRGDLSHRVPVRSDNDLGVLAGSINTMAGDIEKMLDAKRQLLLGVSHELRSPLTRARIAVSLLDDSAKRDSISDDLDEMQTLITEILETERMNTGHAALDVEPSDPHSLVLSVVNDLDAASVVVENQSALTEIQLDVTRVRLLVRNVLNNAITHTPDDRPPPVVQLRDINTVSGRYLTISVKDFGDGIAPEHIASVTEPFYRTDSSRTRATGGFGIGLYLCRLIAEAHNGSLGITSTEGAGTEVTASFPV